MTTEVIDAPGRERKKPKLRGFETPRIYTPELRELTPETSDGFACIAFAEQILGVTLLPWQKWLLIHALELLPNNTYRFRTVVCLVARQNGKTMVMKVLALWHIFARRSKLVVGTAQELSLSERSWAECKEMIDGDEELKNEIGSSSNQRGQKYFKLKAEFGGGEYVVKAANRKARGTSADLVLLDELREHTNWEAWSAVSKTIRARASAQCWALSNAGDLSSVVLRHLRALAHRDLGWPDGELDMDAIELPDMSEFEAEFDDYDMEDMEEFDQGNTIGLFEFSAAPDANPRDPMAWAQSNPSLNWTEYVPDVITTRVIRADLEGEPPGVFDTECLCRWVRVLGHGPFEKGAWDDTAAAEGARFEPNTERWICIDTSIDRTKTYIARVGPLAGDPSIILGDIAADRAGTDWVVPWLLANRSRYTGIIVQGSGAPASSLTPDMQTKRGHFDPLAAHHQEEQEQYAYEDRVEQLPFLSDMYDADLPLVVWEGDDLGKALGIVYDKLSIRRIQHLPHPGLDSAATSAATRSTRDAVVIDRRKSPIDASPLVAFIGAVWGMMRLRDSEPEPAVHAFSEDQIRQWQQEGLNL